MKKKTIVFVQNIEYPQQWAVDIFYYSKYLSKYEDIKVKVIVSKINENISNKNLEIIELWKINYFLFIIKSFFIIKRINKNEKIDYVYFFAQNPFSVLLQFFVKYLLNIKTIYDVVSWPIGKWIIPFISKITIKLWVYFSYKYVVLDKWLIEKLNLSKNKNHEIIPMWYDEEIFIENKNINLFNKKQNKIIFTYIWTLNIERNLDIFIQAFIENIKINNNIKLYFIWSWTWEERLKNISKNYLDKNIFFLWKKEHREIPGYINSSDILVSYIPKIVYFEYQPPTKLIEYVACNKPVIVTNTIAQSEIMSWYEFLIHRDDFESTIEKIQYFIENIEDLKKNNYSELVEKFSWEKLVGKIVNLL